MLPAPTPDELELWLQVAGPATATGSVLWTRGNEELSFGWVAFGGPPLFMDLPVGVEVSFVYGGAGRWALDGPDGPLARTDSRRAVVWRDGVVEVGGTLMAVPGPEQLLLPEAPQHRGGAHDVQADELLGRTCWRWSVGDEVRWVDEQTGCLLKKATPAGVLELTTFEPGARVDPSLFVLDEWAGPEVEESDERTMRERQVEPTFVVPWWPHGTLSYPVAGDPDVPSLLVLLNTGDARAPSAWVGVAPAGERAPVRPGVGSRRWDGQDCALSLSWTRTVSKDDVERIIASMPDRWL